MAESLVVRRGLADSLGTPESLHDLVISLSNLASVVERLGDAERAESLRAERDRLIRQLRAEDEKRWSYGALAKAIGCSRELIAQVVKRR